MLEHSNYSLLRKRFLKCILSCYWKGLHSKVFTLPAACFSLVFSLLLLKCIPISWKTFRNCYTVQNHCSYRDAEHSFSSGLYGQNGEKLIIRQKVQQLSVKWMRKHCVIITGNMVRNTVYATRAHVWWHSRADKMFRISVKQWKYLRSENHPYCIMHHKGKEVWATLQENLFSSVFNKVRFKTTCSATEASKGLEIFDVAKIDAMLSGQRTANMLIRLCG